SLAFPYLPILVRSVPQELLPDERSQDEWYDQPRARLRTYFAGLFLAPLLMPNEPRDLVLRGHFAESADALQTRLEYYTTRRAQAYDAQQVVEWFQAAKQVDPQTNAPELDRLWKQYPDVGLMVEKAAANSLLSQLKYLRALGFQEKAERLLLYVQH